ncbi:hypothetical protein Tco_0039123 [Tanacetum coccineum]
MSEPNCFCIRYYSYIVVVGIDLCLGEASLDCVCNHGGFCLCGAIAFKHLVCRPVGALRKIGGLVKWNEWPRASLYLVFNHAILVGHELIVVAAMTGLGEGNMRIMDFPCIFIVTEIQEARDGKCKYVTRDTRKGRNNEENTDSYEALWQDTPPKARHVTQQDYGVTTRKVYVVTLLLWKAKTSESALRRNMDT